jgi:putative sulfotransferase
MLSNMLREHPKVLSLSEFFGFIDDPSEPLNLCSSNRLDGNQFWAIISATNPFSDFAYRHGIPCSELLYTPGSENARFSAQTGVPGILVTALPHLTDDPDIVFDALGKEVATWQVAEIGSQFKRLFAWLMTHFGKEQWVERTGTSMMRASRLLTLFPDARFIHLARDGRDTVLSMREHNLFRVGYLLVTLKSILGYYPIATTDPVDMDRVPEELRRFLPEKFDLASFLSLRAPLPFYVDNWQQQIASGRDALEQLPPERLLTLRYEDFLVYPKRQLDLLADFMGKDIIDEEWSTRCAATVRPPRSTWRDLPMDEARALTKACGPGFEMLREAGVEYEA